jgi:hypothetical protein
MKRAVICEGKTDAILVGYFLIKVCGWFYSKRVFLPLPFDKQNEVLNWFTRPDKAGSELVVWGAGGITRVSEKVSAIIERSRDERRVDDRFSHVVVLIDRDNRTANECQTLISTWFRTAGLQFAGDVRLDQWTATSAALRKTPAELHRVQALSIVLPPMGPGCLEIFLAEALRSNGDPDRPIVDACERLVAATPAEPYLQEARFRPKATIGAALSIMSPDWVFGDLDEKLTAVAWEEIEMAHNAYARLADL